MGAVVLDNGRIRMVLAMFHNTQGELARAAGFSPRGSPANCTAMVPPRRGAGGQEATLDADDCSADPRIGEAADPQPPPGLQRTSLVGQRTPTDSETSQRSRRSRGRASARYWSRNRYSRGNRVGWQGTVRDDGRMSDECHRLACHRFHAVDSLQSVGGGLAYSRVLIFQCFRQRHPPDRAV